MPWHTPDAKIEDLLKDFFTQLGGNELNGLQILTRFELTKQEFPCVVIGVKEAGDFLPEAVDHSGNWSMEVELTFKSKIRETSGDAHDAYVGRCTDLLMDADVKTDLNTLAVDSDILVNYVRVKDRTNDWENADNLMVTKQLLDVVVVPSGSQSN